MCFHSKLTKQAQQIENRFSAKFENIPEDVISELMGHSSVAVTKSYLKDFGSGVLDDAMSKLN